MSESERMDAVFRTVKDFCLDFLEHPYLCYTEHGVHALFYHRLLQALPEESWSSSWKGQRFLSVQKEYPTNADLGKSRRQHWDIAILEVPPRSARKGVDDFDYLRLSTAIEFGLNASAAHLKEDLRRLTHRDANVASPLAVHLVRTSHPGQRRFSGRDASPSSDAAVPLVDVQRLSKGHPNVDLFYCMADITGTKEPGAWTINNGVVSPLK